MKIKFIKDEVFSLDKQKDLLGTLPYSNTLFDIIKNTSGKTNIGLFGSWGSGKSTILKTLKTKIEEYNNDKNNKINKIAFFEFDAWKYSKDDFRRSFILEFKKKFDKNIIATDKLKELLYSETTVEDPKKSQYKFNKWVLADWLILIITLMAVLFIILPIMDTPEQKGAKNVITIIFFLITLFSTALKNTISKYKVVVKENKLIEPERFEKIFNETVDGITNSNSSSIKEWIKKLINSQPSFSKIIIVIDNLDRCDDENLIVTLNTIKNFLEHDKVIFILPVDEKGVSSFLSDKTDNANEYLRKIFHLIIRLKEFSKRELYEFTSKLNNKYQLELTSKSIRLICQEFTNNPRKIIQFLNNYQSEKKLVKEQSNLGYISNDYIKENINFFIKILIIKYEWRDLYCKLLYDRTVLNKINNGITTLKINEDGLYPVDGTKINLTDEQRNFLYSTQDISCSKIDPFVQNIDLDINIPDEVNDFIRYANYDKITNYLVDKNTEFNASDLLQKMNELYEEFVYKRMEYSLIAIPLLDLIFKFVLDKNQENFKQELIKNHYEYSFIRSVFENVELKTVYNKFSFKTISYSMKWFSDNINDYFYDRYIDFFKSKYLSGNIHDDELENIELFIQIFKNKGKLNELKIEFDEKIINRPEISKIKSIKDFSISTQLFTKEVMVLISKNLVAKQYEKKGLNHYMEEILYNFFLNNLDNNELRENLSNHLLYDLESFYNTEDGISSNTFIDYQYYFEKLNILLKDTREISLSKSFKDMLTAINSHLINYYKEWYIEDKHSELYKSYLRFIQSAIFYTNDFNDVSLRANYFDSYLKIDKSKTITLEINKLLYNDIERYDSYDYVFADTLIDFYYLSNNEKYNYFDTILSMVKNTKNENGLSKSQLGQIGKKTIEIFALNPSDERSISNLKEIRTYQEDILLKSINDKSLNYKEKYIKNVQKLKDDWYYGNSISNYLNEYFIGANRRRSTLFNRIERIFDFIPTNVQIETLDHFLLKPDETIYKWFRISYQILDKNVFDIYLKHLIKKYQDGMIGHNNFFEWICDIPKEKFSKKRKEEYYNLLRKITITRKTYVYKKDKALKHLE